MKRLLILVALGLAMAFAPTLSEATTSKRIHVIAKVVQQTFTGDLASPKLGDRIINNATMSSCLTTAIRKWAQVRGYVLSSASRNLPRTRSYSAFSRRYLIRRKSFLGAWPPFPRPVSWDISAFLAAQTPFVKPVVTRHSSCYPTETSTPSLTLSSHTRDSTDFLNSFIAELPDGLFVCLKNGRL